MMIDLLNKFSVNGSYGQTLHWWAMGSLVIVSVTIIILLIRLAILSIVKMIITREIDRLAALLIPTLFNDQDFWAWLHANNAVLENERPVDWILNGHGTRLYHFMVKEVATQTLPSLYDGVLNIQSKKADKQRIDES